jgi:glutamate carboxypeptidase
VTGPLSAEAFDEEAILAGIARWVAIESPTHDRDGVNRMMDAAAAVMAPLGAAITRYPGRDGLGDAMVARVGSADPGILVLAHLDTVHPVGTVTDMVPHREGDRFFGPGAYDMKGGAFVATYALGALLQSGHALRLPVTFLFVPDEEIGSPTSRPLIESEARRHRYVLVPEPAQDHGNLITGRWAFQRFIVEARGVPAHAGATGADGVSAIREIAAQIPAIESISDSTRDVTVSVGVVQGGTFVNVVPDRCRAEVLAVTTTDEDFDLVRRRMDGLRPLTPGIHLEVRPGPVRPLFTPTPEGLSLYERARALANRIGFDPGHGTVGGGSDGNFTGALGVPTLDGVGVCGDGFHTAEEHLFVSSLVPRARLIAELLRGVDTVALEGAAARGSGRVRPDSRRVNTAGTLVADGRGGQSQILKGDVYVDEPVD